MKFGLTNEVKKYSIEYYKTPHVYFAILPVQLQDGRMAVLERVWRWWVEPTFMYQDYSNNGWTYCSINDNPNKYI